ncbi:hypothetical protein INT46_003347 [Mucor plumbeus]|uniref:Uncharacterized protein n=1 Tax=Mucor plumbeus TaxID=97098 RepID=A0A8H7V1D9_9FUNG|nr:hypothetical protein INT46_003347 [Mucor plumbeus]
MTSSDFKLFLQYYNSVYNHAEYIGCTSGLSADHLAMLGYIQVDNSIAKFVSFEMFHNAYKSTESSIKNNRGSFVLAFSSKNGSLSPAQIQYFFRHEVAVMNNQDEFVTVKHTFAMVKWFKPPHLELSSFHIAAEYIELCSSEFEEQSVMSIIPMHYIHSPIAIKLNYIDNMHAFVKMPEQLII